jgi:hypothetical protein
MNGEFVTGAVPEVYLKNPLASGHVNQGSLGGTWTDNGTLAAAPSSPSDL